MKIWHRIHKFTKVSSKFCQMVNEPFQKGQYFLTSCQSGEISQNLVTLDPNHTVRFELHPRINL